MKDGWKNFPAFKNQDVLGQLEAQRLGAVPARRHGGEPRRGRARVQVGQGIVIVSVVASPMASR